MDRDSGPGITTKNTQGDGTQARRVANDPASSSRLLEAVLDNIPVAVYIKDAATLRYLHVNRVTSELAGHTAQAMLGKSDDELFPQPLAGMLTRDDQQVIDSGEISELPALELPSPALGKRLMHVRKVPVADGEGRTTHLLGIAEDVTDQAGMEQSIRRLNDELAERAINLEASNKGLESFASTASHDLRSPLSVVSAYAGLLEKNYGHALDARGTGYLQTIGRNIKRMGALIDDLLAFSRWTRKALEIRAVNMNALVAEVVDEQLRNLGEGRMPPAITLHELPDGHCDPDLLRQVWVNLLSNAIKYSRKNAAPAVGISGRADAGNIVYSVSDNGVGFDMKYAGKLFGAFQRLHAPEDFEGTGMGLVVVQQIVGRHGGRAWADAVEGRGAVFSFSLPNHNRGAAA